MRKPSGAAAVNTRKPTNHVSRGLCMEADVDGGESSYM